MPKNPLWIALAIGLALTTTLACKAAKEPAAEVWFGPFNSSEHTVEWRAADGKPFAIIQRWHIADNVPFREAFEVAQARQVGDPLVADRAVNQPRQFRVGLQQPAPLRHAVGLVVEAFGPELIKVRHQPRRHQL